jgi:hypothetical protein
MQPVAGALVVAVSCDWKDRLLMALTIGPVQAILLRIGKGQLCDDLVPPIENVVKVDRMVAFSTIFLDGLNNIVYSLETSHFQFKAT